MKISELKKSLEQFSDDFEVRVLVDGKYSNIEEVGVGRFYGTVELATPQTISIEQAEGELFSSLYAGQLHPKREALIAKTIGQDRIELIRKEIEKARAEQAAASSAVSSEVSFGDDEEEAPAKPKFSKTQIRKMSDENKLLNYFKGDLELSESDAKELRAKLGSEKVKELYSKVAE